MTQRITTSFLNAQIRRLNSMAGAPNEPYQPERDDQGRLIPNAGTYLLSSAYGGYSLRRMAQGGGESDVFNVGHVSARQLSELMAAYMRGWEAALSHAQAV